MKQKLDDEGNKCTILSKQQKFNEHCCIRCCTPFTFLFNTKRQCLDCKYNICKSCSAYEKKEKAWICSVCQQARLLRTQSLEWYYNNVKSRFKRFGSAKVLKNLYRKHRLQSGACADLIEGSIIGESIENDGSICGSDSTFYRQTEGHSMMDTLAVALRVAEEAVEEAISKAEACSDSLDKQHEACYLREHKEELIEELATTIVQKIIRRKKSKSEVDFEWPQQRSSNLMSSPMSDQHMLMFPENYRGSNMLWRSPSAFSLTSEDTPSKELDFSSAVPGIMWQQRKDQIRGPVEPSLSSLASWKCEDRLDNSSPPPLLQSSDGNWLALQNMTLPRPRILAKPKNQLIRALENESSVVSAYDEMGSDSEEEAEWNVALTVLHQRPGQLSDDSCYAGSQYNTEWVYGNDQYHPVTSPSSGLYTNTETVYSDSETSSVNSSKEIRGFAKLPLPKRKSPNDQMATNNSFGKLDINLNPHAASLNYSDSSETEEVHYDAEKRSRKWRKAKTVSEDLCEKRNHIKVQPKNLNPHKGSVEADVNNGDLHHQAEADVIEEELKARLSELATETSDKEPSSSEEHDSSEARGRCVQEDLKKKYSAVSLCNISTEVLKVINATEELIAETTSPLDCPAETCDRGPCPLAVDPGKLDEQLTKLEENVYLTAGSVYGLEGQLNELEDSARKINSITTESELADLEDQVATAAAQVHHAERQISDIESRISALTFAGLNITPCARLSRKRDQTHANQVQTIDTSRQQRRKLPAPPMQGEKAENSQVTTLRTFNRNFILQGSLTQRNKDRNNTAKELLESARESTVMY